MNAASTVQKASTPTAIAKHSPPGDHPPTHTHTAGLSEECCGPAKGTGLINSPLLHVKTKSLLSDRCVETAEERQIGFSRSLQHGPDRAVEKASFKLKCAPPPPPPPLPTGPPCGAHFGMNVSSVRKQQGGGGGRGLLQMAVFIRNHEWNQTRYRRGALPKQRKIKRLSGASCDCERGAVFCGFIPFRSCLRQMHHLPRRLCDPHNPALNIYPTLLVVFLCSFFLLSFYVVVVFV